MDLAIMKRFVSAGVRDLGRLALLLLLVAASGMSQFAWADDDGGLNSVKFSH